MVPDSYHELEGFNEDIEAALRQQQEIREQSLFDIPQLEIAGHPLKWMSLRSYAVLRWSQNAMITSAVKTKQDAANCVWLHSENWQPGYRFKEREEIAKKITYSDVADLERWINSQFQDLSEASASSSKAKPNLPDTAEIIPIVDLIASQYHWSESEIMDMPIARLWQYRRQIRKRLNPKYKPYQLTDAVVDRYVTRWVTQKEMEFKK